MVRGTDGAAGAKVLTWVLKGSRVLGAQGRELVPGRASAESEGLQVLKALLSSRTSGLKGDQV